MTDTVVVDSETSAIVSNQDIEVVTIAQSNVVSLEIENSGASVLANAGGINFRNNLTAVDNGDHTVSVDVNSGVMLVDGTRAMTGNLDMGSKNIASVGNFQSVNADHVAAGAIVDSGTNANGDFVRFESGLQMCWAKVNLDFSDASFQRFSYPKDFTSGVSGSISLDFASQSVDTLDAIVDAAVVTELDEWRVALRGSTPASTTGNIDLFAIGLWK